MVHFDSGFICSVLLTSLNQVLGASMGVRSCLASGTHKETTGQAALEGFHGQGQCVSHPARQRGSVVTKALRKQVNSCSNIALQRSQVLDFFLLPLPRTLQQLCPLQ